MRCLPADENAPLGVRANPMLGRYAATVCAIVHDEMFFLPAFLAHYRRLGADRFILLDAQDWMSDRQINELWDEITRTASPDGRVIFRTAAEPTLLPGRVADDVLGRWEYREAESLQFGRRDRSAIYGGFHLYVKKPS